MLRIAQSRKILLLALCVLFFQNNDSKAESLVEQVLDKSTNAEPANTSNLAEPKLESVPKGTSSQSSNKPATTTTTTTTTTTFGTKEEQDFPEPKSFLEPPIHSTLPTAVSNVLGFNVGKEKVIGKGHPIDLVYRGKPALPVVQTVTFGSPSWAIPPKKKIAVLPTSMPPSVQAPVSKVPTTTKPESESTSQTKTVSAETNKATATVNLRFLTPRSQICTDTVWAYPYPPKPPKQIAIGPLPEQEHALKNMILTLGYSYRPDLKKPYPNGGWRWIHAFETALKKANTGYPHTMITVYPWVNKVFPYVLAECREMNRIEDERCQAYDRTLADYERIHTDLEAQATSRNLFPIEVKINRKGIGQTQLPDGNWWITATRKATGLKFYWQIPVSCSKDQTINVQLTEANALIIGGGW